jgi:hypothetical protein
MKIILFLFLNFISLSLFGQDKGKKTILTIGSSFHPATSSFFGEVGIMRNRLEISSCSFITYGQRYTTEVSYLNNKLFIAPKIGYELNSSLIAMRANIMVYTDFQRTDLRFRPEIGLTFFGLGQLVYSVNIPLTPQEMNELAFHQFSLTFNFDNRIYNGDD